MSNYLIGTYLRKWKNLLVCHHEQSDEAIPNTLPLMRRAEFLLYEPICISNNREGYSFIEACLGKFLGQYQCLIFFYASSWVEALISSLTTYFLFSCCRRCCFVSICSFSYRNHEGWNCFYLFCKDTANFADIKGFLLFPCFQLTLKEPGNKGPEFCLLYF